MGLAPIIPYVHFNSCVPMLCSPPLFHGCITKKKPQACAMLCVTCKGHICLIMFHGFARFLKLYVFSKGLPSPLVHPLHGTTQSNTTRWLDKGSNNRQWLATLWMIQEEGPMLFAKGVIS